MGSHKKDTSISSAAAKRSWTEEELQKKQEELQIIFDSIPAMIFYKDKDNRMVHVNRAFIETMGLNKEKIEGRSCFELWPEQADGYWCDDKEVMESGEPKTGIIEPLITAKGKIWVETDKIPYRNEKGEIVGVIGFALDVTYRKEAQEALTQSEEEYRSLVNNVNIGVYRNTPELHGRFLKVNPAMAKMFGYGSPEELMQIEVSQLYQDPQDRARFIEKIKKTNFAQEEELRMKKKDGSSIWAAVTAKVNFDNNGKPQWIDGVIEDITERKKARQELELLNKELVKSNQKLKQLVLRDPHTGLFNHRYLGEVIEAEFHRAKRYAHPLSVMMLDIDYFKSVNDVYGHLFGDLVLKQLARQLKGVVRQYDIVIRFGGEEFMIVSPGIDRMQALTLARRILDAINLYNFGDKNQTVKLKLSIAVASYPEDRINKGMDLVAITDEILSKVKEYGGNNVYSILDINKKERRESQNGRSGKVKPNVKSLQDKIEKLTKRTNQSLIEAVFAFAKTIELKDHSTGEHVEKTVQYATQIGRALGLTEEEIDQIKQGTILHDLGKIGISEKILVKKLKLTRQEFEEIKKHPQIGVDIIRPIKFLHNIIPLILYHHERWDGRGYPNGLKGEEIPIGARVIALADVYQALTSDRPYRKAYSIEEALKIISKGSGTQFDPRMVTKFLQLLQPKK
ncbi:MAG: diguanylate cyclase [Candidatus Omnitrophica bacterium]|nr:diguanylate cyclase [Candidatus Omnitrophota bacterium]MDD5592906.1 diguanylate cyclase [Candidatus Omnitrophota bacterium]